MFDDDELDTLLEEMSKPKELDPFVDPAYPAIKAGVKFTPIERGPMEYSVFTVVDAHPHNNYIKVQEVVYTWCTGYYSRLNKTPFDSEIDRDDLVNTHSPACQGKKKVKNWR